MKLSYIIIAHKNPKQLHRLIKSLNFGDVSFYIHINRKSRLEEFELELSGVPCKITWLSRQVIKQNVGFVEATLNGMATILKNEPSVDFVLLISGQDYPIKPLRDISLFLENHLGSSFINFGHMPTNFWLNGGMNRIQKYHFWFLGKHYTYPPDGPLVSLKSRLFYPLVGLFFPKKRNFPPGLEPFGGLPWWCITSEACHYILEFLSKRPDYLKFHRYTWAPEEGFFQTILLNSEKFANTIIDEDLRYIEWVGLAVHPEVLTKKDFNKLVETPKLFARKFDIQVDSTILDMIDEKLLLL